MLHRLLYPILILFLSLGLSSQISAQEQLLRQVYDTETNTWVEVTCLLGKLPSYGYTPIRVKVHNGTQTNLQLDLHFTSSNDQYSFRGGENTLKSSFFCSATPGRTDSFDFLVPVNTVTNVNSYNTGAKLDLTLLVRGFKSTDGSMFSENSEDWPAVLMSSALYVPNSSTLDSHINKSSRHRGGDLEFAGSFDPKKMPEDWRAYQGQDAILMTSDDWKSISPGAKLAILEWNRLGGKIIIYTENTTEDLATLNIDKELAGKRRTTRSLGTVQILPLPTASRLSAVKTEKLIKDGNLSNSSHSSLLNNYSKSWPLLEFLGEKNFNISLFLIILLAFGILVGPINLFVFAKAGQRHKLFITTPLISLGASVLLIILILFQDGFGGRGHRALIMDIQSDANKAYIIQTQAARTGVLIGTSFETSEPTMITPLALASSRWSRVIKNGKASSSYGANHGKSGLSLSGDWFQSRSVHGHLLQTIRPTRATLALSGSAKSPALSSTFEFNLGTIYYQDNNARWWKTDSLKKGATSTLTESSLADFETWLHTQQKNFAAVNSSKITTLSGATNRFYTVTTDAKAIETSKAIKWLTTTTLITGEL